MFSMGRDERMPFGKTWGHVNGSLKTPANAAIAVAVLAAIPLILTGAGSAAILAIAATGLIYFSYFLCNMGVLVARRRGFPHQPAPFSLGRWGMLINILALVWGAAMIINIGIWTDEALFGVYGNDLRMTWTNPFINDFLKFQGNVLTGLPHWPVFETVLGVILLVGILYYLAVERGKVDKQQIEADTVTGEAVIG
jgi:amino acid transporter